MSNKQMVLEALRKLPEEASLDEISEEIAILAAIQHGKDDADAGRVLTHDEVKARSAAWTSQ
jgi:predicted transcriptional regulator